MAANGALATGAPPGAGRFGLGLASRTMARYRSIGNPTPGSVWLVLRHALDTSAWVVIPCSPATSAEASRNTTGIPYLEHRPRTSSAERWRQPVEYGSAQSSRRWEA